MTLEKINYSEHREFGEIYKKVKNNELPLGELVLKFAKLKWIIYLAGRESEMTYAERDSDLEGLGLGKDGIDGLEMILGYSFIDDTVISIYKYDDTYSILIRAYFYENEDNQVEYKLIKNGQFNDDGWFDYFMPQKF